RPVSPPADRGAGGEVGRDLWHAASPDGRAVALATTEFLRRALSQDLRSDTAPDGTALDVIAPGEEFVDGFLVTVPVGPWMPEWHLVVRPLDQGLFDASATRQIQAYVLVGMLVIVVFVLVALLALRWVGRQLHLTRLKNDLLSTVSHELRTPLASMRLLLDTLLMAEPSAEARGAGAAAGDDEPPLELPPERRREYLQMISAENARLSRLVESFLTFSKLDRRDHRFARRDVDPRIPAEDAAAAVADRFRAAGCALESTVDGDLPDLVADPESLTTALVNLLDNACKYSDPGAAGGEDGLTLDGPARPVDRTVSLRLYRDGRRVAYAVSDTGIGIPRAELGRIFNRFYQVDQRLQRRTDGTGLGLAIVKAIAEAHRGTVSVDSELGEGSTFTLRIPIQGA
ncbi:MAG: ATP-binding protein, partial [Acidobacteriota bacterium]